MNLNEVAYGKALREVIRKYKPQKNINYNELTDLLVIPFKLDADQMDELVTKVEDAGISIVDDKGNPSAASLKVADKQADEVRKQSAKEAVAVPTGVKVNDPVRMYLKEIGRVDLLSAEEEKALAIRIENGDEEAKQRLAEANLRLVVSIAK
ncbi:MAG: RNA polymerase sigma factor RpoD, partial [Ligilactobacillus sp.]|nr:RNA polymerase sigma factor RpoD [Ligilactobacillus sp.]